MYWVGAGVPGGGGANVRSRRRSRPFPVVGGASADGRCGPAGGVDELIASPSHGRARPGWACTAADPGRAALAARHAAVSLLFVKPQFVV